MIGHLKRIVQIAADLPRVAREEKRNEAAARQMADKLSNYSGDVGAATTELYRRHNREFSEAEREQIAAIRVRACEIVDQQRRR